MLFLFSWLKFKFSLILWFFWRLGIFLRLPPVLGSSLILFTLRRSVDLSILLDLMSRIGLWAFREIKLFFWSSKILPLVRFIFLWFFSLTISLLAWELVSILDTPVSFFTLLMGLRFKTPLLLLVRTCSFVGLISPNLQYSCFFFILYLVWGWTLFFRCNFFCIFIWRLSATLENYFLFLFFLSVDRILIFIFFGSVIEALSKLLISLILWVFFFWHQSMLIASLIALMISKKMFRRTSTPKVTTI